MTSQVGKKEIGHFCRTTFFSFDGADPINCFELKTSDRSKVIHLTVGKQSCRKKTGFPGRLFFVRRAHYFNFKIFTNKKTINSTSKCCELEKGLVCLDPQSSFQNPTFF